MLNGSVYNKEGDFEAKEGEAKLHVLQSLWSRQKERERVRYFSEGMDNDCFELQTC